MIADSLRRPSLAQQPVEEAVADSAVASEAVPQAVAEPPEAGKGKLKVLKYLNWDKV